MTIPSERTRAVVAAREFMVDLITPSATPKVPRAIRERALRCLRHYPGSYDLARTAAALPEQWGKVE
ncbi:MAG: BPSL0761 family protein [Candidatus Binatia bacterium]|nr:BPSL0761 family protein [Candidatus Binatia bacterium]